MYALGIDLGTTFTAAATWRDGRAEVASLGSRTAAIPSVVLLREDRTVLTGETANRRALSEPDRVAREFKRRLGDTTPILLGGTPYSAEQLTARLLHAVVDEVAAREGGPSASLCVSHPANWGPYKTDLLRQAVRIADLPPSTVVGLVSEPEAAAAFYARQQRIALGAIVAVYDLGGGTFDAAVLRKTEAGFDILGQPEGIERLGGIDFDAAVFAHVAQAIGGKLAELDEDDPAALTAVARLREECTDAKEALSADTDVAIPVLLPNLSTEVRLTRAELENMIRPAVADSIDALQRALAEAGVGPGELHSVLLVGGSSRIPLVAQMVGAELGRPVAVDAHPKHAVSLGAAWLAAEALGEPAGAGAAVAAVTPAPVPAPGAAAAAAHLVPTAAPAAPPAPAAAPKAPVPGQGSAPAAATASGPAAGITEVIPAVPATARTPARTSAGTPARAPARPVVPPAGPPVRPPSHQPGPPTGRSAAQRGSGRRTGIGRVIFGGLTALLLVAGGVAMAANLTGRPETAGDAAGAGTPTSSPTSTLPPDEQCTEAIKQNPRWVCLTSATFDGLTLTADFVAEFGSSTPASSGYHLHIYRSDVSTGSNGEPLHWYVETSSPSRLRVTSKAFALAVGDATKICARIANGQHGLVRDLDGGFDTGNCVSITKTGAAAAGSLDSTTTRHPTAPGRQPTPTSTMTPTPTMTSSTATDSPTVTVSPTVTLTATVVPTAGASDATALPTQPPTADAREPDPTATGP